MKNNNMHENEEKEQLLNISAQISLIEQKARLNGLFNEDLYFLFHTLSMALTRTAINDIIGFDNVDEELEATEAAARELHYGRRTCYLLNLISPSSVKEGLQNESILDFLRMLINEDEGEKHVKFLLTHKCTTTKPNGETIPFASDFDYCDEEQFKRLFENLKHLEKEELED